MKQWDEPERHSSQGDYDDLLQELDDLQRSLSDPNLDLCGLQSSAKPQKKDFSISSDISSDCGIRTSDLGQDMGNPSPDKHVSTLSMESTQPAVYVSNLVVTSEEPAVNVSTDAESGVFVSTACITLSGNKQNTCKQEHGGRNTTNDAKTLSAGRTYQIPLKQTAIETRIKMAAPAMDDASVDNSARIFHPERRGGRMNPKFLNENDKDFPVTDGRNLSVFSAAGDTIPSSAIRCLPPEMAGDTAPKSRLAALQERANRKLSMTQQEGTDDIHQEEATAVPSPAYCITSTTSTTDFERTNDCISLDFPDLESPTLMRSAQRRFDLVTSGGYFPHARTPSIENLAQNIIKGIRKKSPKQ
jgi:hypothetical protein